MKLKSDFAAIWYVGATWVRGGRAIND